MKCEICKGAKKVVRVVDGQPYAEDCPRCAGTFTRDEQLRKGIPARFSKSSFDNFEVTNSRLATAKGACLEWLSNPSGWLILSGPPGVGKTHLMCSMAAKIKRCLYVSAVEMFALERKRIDQKDIQIKDFSTYTGVLFLDELGAGMGTDWERDLIHRLVAVRYDESLPTVFSTNFRFGTGSERSLERSGRILPHTASRLLGECRVIEIDSDDRRRNVATK